MTSTDAKLKRREAHSAYQKMRTEYRARLAEKPIEIKPEDFADATDNLLKGPNLNNGLNVYIPKWDNLAPPGDPEKIEVLFDRGNDSFVVVASHEFVVPIGGTDLPEAFPFEMVIKANELPQNATCQLKYRHYTYQEEEFDSPVMQVICDRLPPYSGAAPALKFATDYVDDTTLPQPNSTVAATIPGYADWQATDKIAIYWVDSANAPEDPTANPPVFYDLVPAPGITDTTVQIPGSKIRAIGDAECFIAYALIDRALNPAVSLYQKMSVTFGPLPTNLQPPEVPQADPGPLVVEHALAGVDVWISKYDNPKPNDHIRLKWGSTTLPDDYPVGPNPPARIVVPVVPIATLVNEYGKDTTGNKPTNVSYQVIRSGRVFGPEATDIEVNLEVAIPWDPWPPVDWPKPIHPSLLEGEVKSSDGIRTNQLTRADKGQDAKFTFTWYDEAVNGHIVDFFWNGARVVEAQITFDDTNTGHVPGGSQTVDIPWQYIKGGGNGTEVPVHYQVGRADLPNDLNSAPALVDVNAIAIELPSASFPTIDTPYPGCKDLEADGSLQVAIPDLSTLLKNGNTIRVVFTPMRGEDLNDAEDPIPGAEFEQTFELGPDWDITGFIFLVQPYDKHILPLYNENPSRRGRAKIQYFFNDGTEEIESTHFTTRTAFHLPNGPCEIPRP
ncbi:hypothetical protein [Pseudomonas sp. Z2-11]